MMRTVLRHIWHLLVACLLFSFLCTGCAIVPKDLVHQGHRPPQIEPGHGLLTLKITSNRSGVADLTAKWETVHLRNKANGQEVLLYNRLDNAFGHSLFINSLAPGTYTIEQVSSIPSNLYVDHANVSNDFPSFTVKAGQLTDLETLVYLRDNYPLQSRAFRWGYVSAPTDFLSVLHQLPAPLAATLQDKPILGWDDEIRLRDRRAVFGAGMSATMRATATLRMKDGTLLFGESFGQIAVRSTTGVWHMVQTPTAMLIRNLYSDDGDTIYAAADDGLLFSGHLGSNNWQQITLPVQNGIVSILGKLTGSADLFIVLTLPDNFIGLTTSQAAPGNWVEVFNRPHHRGYFSQAPRVMVFQKTGQMDIITGGKGRPTELLTYDAGQRNWRFRDLGADEPLGAWAPMSPGEIGKFAGIPLTGMYFTASNDYGRTWQKRGDLNWALTSLMFTSKTTGYVIRTDSRPVFDAEKIELSLWRTDDAGMTWAQVGRMPGVKGKLIQLHGDSGLGYFSGNGRFYVSGDGGRTWGIEHQVR